MFSSNSQENIYNFQGLKYEKCWSSTFIYPERRCIRFWTGASVGHQQLLLLSALVITLKAGEAEPNSEGNLLSLWSSRGVCSVVKLTASVCQVTVTSSTLSVTTHTQSRSAETFFLPLNHHPWSPHIDKTDSTHFNNHIMVIVAFYVALWKDTK